MRVNATAIQSLVASVGNLNARQTDISSELSSGVRLNRISDDPVASGQASRLADALRRDDSFISGASTAGNRMQASDSALSSAVTQLTSAITTATGAYNSTNNVASRATAIQQLQSIRESLVSLGNSSYNGTYLFSGTSAAQPFTEAANGTVTYSGNTSTSAIPLASGGTVQGSLAGSPVFLASGASVFDSLNAVISDLSSGGTNPSAYVGNLKDALTNVSAQRATLNTAQNRLSNESTYVSAQKTNLAVEQSTLLTPDTVALATELSAVSTQRSALLNTISIVEKGSIFDYIQ